MRAGRGPDVAGGEWAAPEPRRRPWLLTSIFVVACAAALLLLSRSVDFAGVLARLRSASPMPIAFACLGYLGGLALLCVRWHALVTTLKPMARFRNSVDALTASLMLNYASPGSVGVPARAVLTRRLEGLPFAALVPLAAGEAFLDVAVLAALAGAALLVAGPEVAMPLMAPVTERISAALVAGLALAVVATGAIAVWLCRGTAARLLRPGVDAIRGLARRPGTLLRVFVLAGAFWLAQIGIVGLLFAALGQVQSLAFLLPFTVLPLLAGMVVPVPGGAGVREALMVGTAQAFGVSLESALIVAVLYRLLLFITDPILFLAAKLGPREG